jgi:hypothetical protein
MAERVVLHVGAMKSGTSYIQSLLFANQATLADQGVLVPGSGWRDQVNAVTDVLGRVKNEQVDVTGSWGRLLDEISAWAGTAVVSMEFLGPIPPARIATVVDSLRPARVSVILSARDLNRSIAAMWQETVQNGHSWTWASYLDGVERGRPRAGRTPDDVTEAGRRFWRQQNTVRLSRHWLQAEVDDFTFLTVAPPGSPSGLLAQRFGLVVGFDATTLEPGPRANTSVDAAAAEVLRRTNALLAKEGLPFPHGSALRKRHLAKTVLAGRSRRPDLTIGLPLSDWVVEHARAMVTALQELGVDLVGDWADLDPAPVPGIDPRTVAAHEVVQAAEDGLRGIEPVLRRRLGDDWDAFDGEPGLDPVDAAVGRLAAALARAIRAESVP